VYFGDCGGRCVLYNVEYCVDLGFVQNNMLHVMFTLFVSNSVTIIKVTDDVLK